MQRVHEEQVDTEFGPFRLVAYRDAIRRGLHYALVRGKVNDGAPVLSRVHVRNTLSDVLHLKRDDLGLTVTSALRRIADEDRGVLLVLSGEDTPDALLARLNRQPARRRRRTCSSRNGASTASARRCWPTSACTSCACSARRASWSAWPASGWRWWNTSELPLGTRRSGFSRDALFDMRPQSIAAEAAPTGKLPDDGHFVAA